MSETPTNLGAVAIVSGAAGVLGRAIVTELRACGARVIAVDRTTDGDGDLDVRRETADVTDATSVDDLFNRVIQEHGRIDVVVHSVGAFRAGGIVDSSEEDWQLMVDLNLTGAWWMSRAAARVMQQAGSGSIVHIGARNSVEALPGAAAYGVTKAALAHLTRVLDSELRGSGVRVNAVLPGVIDTPANRTALSTGAMRRAVSPQAIAKVIAFLASEDAAPVSGAVIPVYGTG